MISEIFFFHFGWYQIWFLKKPKSNGIFEKFQKIMSHNLWVMFYFWNIFSIDYQQENINFCISFDFHFISDSVQ